MTSIDIFPWNDNFDTGVQKIDGQHRKLVQLLNLLANHVAFKADIPLINQVFEELADYAVYHFQTEESIWHQYLPEDPLETAHKSAHDGFIETVSKLKAEESTTPREALIEEILAFLTHWLASHILENDRYLAQVVLAMQSGMPLELAKTHAKEQMGGLTKVLISIILSTYETVTTNTLNLMRELARRGREEDALRRKQELMLSLLNTSPIAVRITALSGDRVLFANARYAKLTNMETDKVIGTNPKQYYAYPQDYEDVLCQIGQGKAVADKLVELSVPGIGTVWTLATYFKIDYETGPAILGWFYDVTSIRETEDTLRKLSLAVEQSPSSIVITGLDANIEFVNDAFVRETGYSRAEAIGQNPRLLQSGKTPRKTYDDMWEALGRDQSWKGEFVNKRKDGSEYTEMALVSPIHQPDGQTTHYLAIKDDITERKQIETALHNSNQQLSSLLNSMAEGAYGVDIQGNCRFVNRSFLEILGYENAEEIIGKHIHELIHHSYPDGRPYPAAECRMYAAYRCNQEIYVSDEVFWRKDGSAVPVEYWSQPIITDGVMTGAISTFVDITERKRIEAKLIQSESRLRAIIDSEPECIKIIDAQGLLVMMNPAGLAMLEADKLEQVLGKPVINVIAPKYRKAYAEMHKQVLAGASMQLQYEILGFKGGCRWLETHAVPMKEANGNIMQLAVTRDITRHKEAEQQLRIAATVFDSQEGMMVTDANNVILRVNKAFTDITGYSAEDVVGKDPRILESGREDQAFFTAMWASIEKTGAWHGEVWNRRKNGEVYPQYLTITAVKDQDGIVTHHVGTLTDISLRKSAEEKIERLAFYDPLTNLPNRRLLYDRLKSALATSYRNGLNGALLFIDLDNFKTLNDSLGHDMGDLLLQQVAERLIFSVREADTVARLGGDEFVVMLENLSDQPIEAAAQAETIGKKILAAINQPFLLVTHTYHSTPSIGVTLFNGHQQSADDLLKNADIAMYQAKMSGRNTLRFFDQRMQDVITLRVLLEDDLRKAVVGRQFQLYYQIQVDGSLCPIGAEALIRWAHPKLGLLAPAEFIPLAEETGLILPIGQWVLESVCAQLKAWQQDPRTRRLEISLNVSTKQFFQTDFVAQVQTAIQQYAINPKLLKLELTEGILLKNVEETVAIMNALVEMGVQFSLDDFGTGYSSLQYLKKLPINQLKIDQSFVQDITVGNNDQVIVRTIIAMATSMNLGVIAEGVETEEQRQFLVGNGCINYQGYLFGKPLPIAQFDLLVREWVGGLSDRPDQ